MNWQELGRQLAAKREELHNIWGNAKTDNPEVMDFTKAGFVTDAAALEEIEKRTSEIDELSDKFDNAYKTHCALEKNKKELDRLNEVKDLPGFDGRRVATIDDRGREKPKSIGELYCESAAYKEYRGSGSLSPESLINVSTKDMLAMREFKTLFERGAGWAPESTRTGQVVLSAQRPIKIIDLIPQMETTQAAVKYMEETTFTSTNAVEKAEGAAYGEVVLALTERSVTVEKLPVIIPVTDEQLADEPFVRDYLNNRLEYMLQARLDNQAMNGTGSTPLMLGILQKSGIQTQAKGADDIPTAIYKAITLVRFTGFAEPTACVMHPTDAQTMLTLKTADGVYIWGAPNGEPVQRIWGLPIAISPVIADDTSLVGDFQMFSFFASRAGIEFQTGYVGDNFKEGKISIRAQLRGCFVWTRAAAFCTITGVD